MPVSQVCVGRSRARPLCLCALLWREAFVARRSRCVLWCAMDVTRADESHGGLLATDALARRYDAVSIDLPANVSTITRNSC